MQSLCLSQEMRLQKSSRRALICRLRVKCMRAMDVGDLQNNEVLLVGIQDLICKEDTRHDNQPTQ